ncbi:protein of unknown function DUF4397 (plasmid) [Gemmatirosa kalamazoonensis]|uniref:DUF4397 domain-containing protein n=1 Tax=Gemmatirosa kalamazoonensis TaxID=861299 RepID=W0RSM1_9BACT|nr:DUF4397 domain-containing protein [Gemmatirosa kalamazoonensis]AHG93300.1 protein of unknown function DUF4397 [Gemmatirosa kalamazoonensis]
MKTASVMPVVATVLCAAACGDSPTAVATPAKVRFFNAVWPTQDKIGFTTNTQFAAGSALAYLQSTPTCSTLDAGTTTFGIGLANASGTALNSNTFVTLNDQTITDGGDYIVLAGGNINHPSVVLLDNSFSGTLGANQAAVRFVNLAGGSEGPVDVSKGTAGSGPTTVVRANMGFRDATPFSTVTSGPNPYTITYTDTNQPLVSGSDATLNLQAGTVNTIVISRLNPPTGNFQLINVPRCN